MANYDFLGSQDNVLIFVLIFLTKSKKMKSVSIKSCVLICTFFFIASLMVAQDVEIFHGINPNTSIVKGRAKNFVEPNTTFKIRITNPNPYYYNYSFKLDTSKIEVESPQFSDLVNLVFPLLKENVIESQKESNKVQGRVRAPIETSEFDSLFKELKRIETSWDELDNLIKQSDVPEALNTTSPNPSNFSLKQNEVKNLPDLALNIDIIDKAMERAKELDESIGSVTKSKGNFENFVETVKTHCKNLVSKRNNLKKEFISLSDEIIFDVKIKENQSATVTLSITKKGEYGSRQAKENLIQIIIIPNYRTPKFEIVPIGAMVFQGKTKEYGLNDGIITLSDVNKFPFRPGALFNFNFVSFGERNINSIAFGIGTSLSASGKNLDNFQGACTLSFADRFRIGLGGGYTQVPGSLKNNNIVGNNIVGDVKSIDDIINYEKKFAIYLNFSIFDLNIIDLFK